MKKEIEVELIDTTEKKVAEKESPKQNLLETITE